MTVAEVQRPRRLRSECGQYFAERLPAEPGCSSWHRLFDRDENVVVEKTTYWINRSTKTRIGFETGSGPISATFSYPRYPRWFRRRWVSCFDMPIEDLAKLVEGFGCEVLVGFKVGMTVWSSIGFRATSKQLRKVDEELDRRGVEWNGPPMRGGQWEIECPSKARWGDSATKKEVVQK